ncbi:MAG: helix-turn-helix domain-containing protein [Blastococcus sp.]
MTAHPTSESGRDGSRATPPEPQQRGDGPASDALLLTPEEAAKVLRLGRTTVFVLMKAGELRRVHIGRSCRLSRAELERYVSRLQTPPPPPPTRARHRRRLTTTNQGELFDLVHNPPEEA